jgi:hypothetical protein
MSRRGNKPYTVSNFSLPRLYAARQDHSVHPFRVFHSVQLDEQAALVQNATSNGSTTGPQASTVPAPLTSLAPGTTPPPRMTPLQSS